MIQSFLRTFLFKKKKKTFSYYVHIKMVKHLEKFSSNVSVNFPIMLTNFRFQVSETGPSAL